MARGKRKSVCNCANKGCNYLNYVMHNITNGVAYGSHECTAPPAGSSDKVFDNWFLYETEMFEGKVDSMAVSRCVRVGVINGCTECRAD